MFSQPPPEQAAAYRAQYGPPTSETAPAPPTDRPEPAQALLRWWLTLPEVARRTMVPLGAVGTLGAAALTPVALVPLGVILLGLVGAGGAGYLVGAAVGTPPAPPALPAAPERAEEAHR